jgi:hypothetical protein
MIVGSVHELRGKAVLEPGVDDDHAHRLVGAAVRVVRPDGTAFDAKIYGVAMPTPNLTRHYPVMLSTGVVEQPVPLGSEVWLHG